MCDCSDTGSRRCAAVLCPGPSLPQTWGPADKDRYDIIIGVNRAAAFWPCTHMAFQDSHTWAMLPGGPKGHPIIISDPHTYARALSRYRMTLGKYGFLPQQRPEWVAFTSNVAIWMAHVLGATEIDVYGMDLDGEEDWDGYTSTKQIRHEQRWVRERRIFNKLAAVLAAEEGVTVRRVGA